jgi:hypothetical protein
VFKKVVQFDDVGIYNAWHADLEFTIFRRTDDNVPDSLLVFDHLNSNAIIEQDIPKPSVGMMDYHYKDGRNGSG